MKRNSEPMSEALKAELLALEAMPDEAIDTSNIASVTDWSGARRGMLYRPIKQQLSLRLDADVVAWFKGAGDGYHTRINRALREYVERYSKRA
ncbi:BrnA antitoxin family protein [Asticcacaulis taihuensis]|uniref:BrnA antitoxin family protein n=1 Tax=Asticcacaulis taihuensis TaxID=260084 RepID=UPI003F7BB02C